MEPTAAQVIKRIVAREWLLFLLFLPLGFVACFFLGYVEPSKRGWFHHRYFPDYDAFWNDAFGLREPCSLVTWVAPYVAFMLVRSIIWSLENAGMSRRAIIAGFAVFTVVAAGVAASMLFGKLLSPTGIFWTSVTIVITVVCAYFQFKAKVSLEPDSPLKANSVISTPFRLTNESVLSIYDIKQEWLIEQYRGTIGSNEFVEVGHIDDAKPVSDVATVLGGSASVTVYPFDHVSYSEAGKRIKLLATITYRTAYYRRVTKTFSFEGDEGTDRTFHWYHTSSR